MPCGAIAVGVSNVRIKTYSELSKLVTFDERFQYLKLKGFVGKETFGFDRVFNQLFYRSAEWKRVRNLVIVRDNGCDLGIDGYNIYGNSIIIHHMNPISLDDIENHTDYLLNPEFLITTIHRTHNAIHYGDDCLFSREPIVRKANDMAPWKR